MKQVVRVVWESLDYVCAERLTPTLLETARHLARFDEMALTPGLEAQLAAISEATVQRNPPRWRPLYYFISIPHYPERRAPDPRPR